MASNNRTRRIAEEIRKIGGDEKSTLDGLKSACGYIRREVGKNIKIRHTPEIIFKIDDSLLKGMYMDELIKKVNNGYKDSSEENEKDGE